MHNGDDDISVRDCLGGELIMRQRFNFKGEGTVYISVPCRCGKLNVDPRTDFRTRWLVCKSCGYTTRKVTKYTSWESIVKTQWPDVSDEQKRIEKAITFASFEDGGPRWWRIERGL